MSDVNILDIPMRDNDAEAKTIREYLKVLLAELWREGEGFSGKRPFGNSSWEYDLYDALVRNKAVSGEIDEEGDLGTFDKIAADQMIADAIASL